ncbi:7581_t:CDS:2 [Ambispora leptoticha]|uniref:7581_t:CDS:1 n=2 Tax=Ambispora leptoticha TaxID=144679 RepID=A0A9N9C0P9_9GLOM|nr:7581_t:CDS:2 [Ambispora leptoticha]
MSANPLPALLINSSMKGTALSETKGELEKNVLAVWITSSLLSKKITITVKTKLQNLPLNQSKNPRPSQVSTPEVGKKLGANHPTSAATPSP